MLISICIPTYNRAIVIEQVLEGFINNSEFDDEVEIVISDNCSTDNTKDICEKYAAQYNNIKYFRNEKNIEDSNFSKVLDLGSGEYLKLLNDWCYMDVESLRYVKDTIRKNINSKRPIFFTNNWLYTDHCDTINYCKNADEFMQVVSTYTTSNNIFGTWREHWLQLDNKTEFSHLKLPQVDWCYKIVTKFQGAIVYNKKILKEIKYTRSSFGYNWFQVHLDNYYIILDKYVKMGVLTSTAIKQDRHYLLQHFTKEICRALHLSSNRNWKYDTNNIWKYLWRYYKNDPYFYYFIITLPLQKYIQKYRKRF